MRLTAIHIHISSLNPIPDLADVFSDGFLTKSCDSNSNIVPERHRTLDDVIHTIAHEVGHIIVGGGHPDEESGKAPLPGTDRARRLMCSGPNWSGDSLLLVKQEWENAEAWLKKTIDDP